MVMVIGEILRLRDPARQKRRARKSRLPPLRMITLQGAAT
jgi:hypothetical protein